MQDRRNRQPRHGPRSALVPAGLVIALGAAACVPARPAPGGSARVGWSQTGVASWYGPGFHGRRTASGEVYDMEAMTAAHRTLPFGTRVRVENLDNGRAARVRINDRGPFVRGRIIDLSRAAARSIRMLGPGTARVRIVLEGASSLARCADVQVGAFARRQNADRLAARLRRAGEPVRVRTESDGLTRVLLGPYSEAAAAERARRRHDGVLRDCV